MRAKCEIRELNRQHHPGDPPDRPHKLLNIADSVLANSMEVVIEKAQQCDPQRNCGHRGGRKQAWNQAQQVRKQNKHQHAGGEHDIALSMRPDDRIRLVGDETMQHLRDLLDSPRLFHIERDAHQDEKDEKQPQHQDLHSEGLGDGRLRIVGLHVDRVQDLRGQIPKVLCSTYP